MELEMWALTYDWPSVNRAVGQRHIRLYNHVLYSIYYRRRWACTSSLMPPLTKGRHKMKASPRGFHDVSDRI